MSRIDRTKASTAVPAKPSALQVELTAHQAPPDVPEGPCLGAFSPRALVDLLFSMAAPKLARDDLLNINHGGAEFVENAAGHAAKVAEGLGCLVLGDGAGPGAAVGSFQTGRSVAELLWHMQAHFEALEAVSSAVGWAASELAGRDEK